MIIRLSQKLAAKIHETGRADIAPDPDPYADWHAHLLTFDRAQYIIVVNSQSLFTFFLHGRGIANDQRFSKAVLQTLHDTLYNYKFNDIFDTIYSTPESRRSAHRSGMPGQ
jgi:hypothetical protein